MPFESSGAQLEANSTVGYSQPDGTPRFAYPTTKLTTLFEAACGGIGHVAGTDLASLGGAHPACPSFAQCVVTRPRVVSGARQLAEYSRATPRNWP